MSKFFASIFSGLNSFAFFLLKGIASLLRNFFDGVDRLLTFFHDAGELFIRKSFKKIRESNNPIVKRVRSASCFYLVIIIVLVVVFFNVVIQMFYVVDIGTRATITRFGAFLKEATPGLHIKLPYVDQVYHVMWSDLLQEHIGFVAVPRTELGPKTPAELAADSYNIKQHALINSGGIFTEFVRGPKLTKDYLIDKTTGPVVSNRLHVMQKRGVPLLEKQEEVMGFPKNGRAALPQDTQILCGNLNIVEVNWVVLFQIMDIKKYLFNSTNARENMRNASKAAMRQVIGDSLDFEAIATARDRIEARVMAVTQKTLDQLDIGIKVAFNFIVEALPPIQVKDSYDAVSIARQEMESKILEARIKYNNIIPQAHGKSEKIIYEAHAYATIVRNKAEGEAERFRLILDKYNKNKEATWDRLYIEGMEKILSHGKVTLLDPEVKGILPILYDKGANQDPKSLLHSSSSPATGSIEEVMAVTQSRPSQLHPQASVHTAPTTHNTGTTTPTTAAAVGAAGAAPATGQAPVRPGAIAGAITGAIVP
ncbi:MAG: FtsH protease activity modulator HflK [Oligoflexia bacterium]|nr:FtsH protease activity modulator HflK [Oligoflexia bacterium]